AGGSWDWTFPDAAQANANYTSHSEVRFMTGSPLSGTSHRASHYQLSGPRDHNRRGEILPSASRHVKGQLGKLRCFALRNRSDKRLSWASVRPRRVRSRK